MDVGVYDEMRERCRDYYIADCALRSPDCLYVLFENLKDDDDDDAESIIRVGFFYSDTERKWGYKAFHGFHRPKSCVLSGKSQAFVAVDFGGGVVSQPWGEGDRKFAIEPRIPLIRQVSVLSARAIAGKAYIAGNLRTVFRRDKPGVWTCLSGNDLSARDAKNIEGREFGFEDVGGFAEDDIYACGGQGDLWHYDGNTWTMLDCPTNEFLTCLCCADNGTVYVGGRRGILLEGRADEWRIVSSGSTTAVEEDDPTVAIDTDIVDLAWFKGRLFIAAEFRGILEYSDGSIRPASGLSRMVPNPPVDDEPESNITDRNLELLAEAGASEEALNLASMPISFQGEGILAPGGLHSLSTDGNILVVGGSSKVAAYDGEHWRIVYAPHGLDEGGFL
jgi:hypothetical protein